MTPAPSVLPMPPAADASIDVLRWPIVGSPLRWRHLRVTSQIVLLLAALALVLHGLFGPQLAPKNLATTAVWISLSRTADGTPAAPPYRWQWSRVTRRQRFRIVLTRSPSCAAVN